MKRLKVYCNALNIKFDGVEKAWLDRTFKEDGKEKISDRNILSDNFLWNNYLRKRLY